MRERVTSKWVGFPSDGENKPSLGFISYRLPAPAELKTLLPKEVACVADCHARAISSFNVLLTPSFV